MQRLANQLKSNPNSIIAIDGEPGAGKSTFSAELGKAYKIPVIHVDDFLLPGQDEYVGAISVDSLKLAVAWQRPLIIEGVCLLRVLEKIGITADIHYFLWCAHPVAYNSNNGLLGEVRKYIESEGCYFKEKKALAMQSSQTNHFDVDIAYLRAKTIVSVVLSVGGITALLVGAYLLGMGISSNDSAVFEILGTKLTAKGIGAVILGSSVFWAYFAYLARPKYARRKETHSNVSADGRQENYEFESATMLTATPQRKDTPRLSD